MNIYIGNLRLKDIIKEQHLKTVQTFLDNNGFKKISKCDDVENEEGNYHIYDIPRQFHICGEKKGEEFIKFVKDEDLLGKGFIGSVGMRIVEPTIPTQSDET